MLWLGYPLQNGVWPDVSKHDNDGAIIGALWERDSLEFDGVDDHINCGNDASLDITGAITIIMKLKRKRLGEEAVAAKEITTSAGWFIDFQPTDELRWYKWGLTVSDHKSTQVITDTDWHHLVFLYNGSQSKIYIDGVLDATVVNTTGNITITTDPVHIGRSEGSGGREVYFQGLIQQVQIYNEAFTAQQVKEAYEQTYKLI